jgi:hypothetical protein
MLLVAEKRMILIPRASYWLSESTSSSRENSGSDAGEVLMLLDLRVEPLFLLHYGMTLCIC